MLTEQDRAASAEILYGVLAATFRALVAAQVYHWNVTGPGFFELHRAFRKLYERLFRDLDRVAERIRALGAPVALEGELMVTPGSSAEEMVLAMMEMLDGAARMTRNANVPEADRATRQMLDELTDCLEHEDWKLRSWLGGAAPTPPATPEPGGTPPA